MSCAVSGGVRVLLLVDADGVEDRPLRHVLRVPLVAEERAGLAFAARCLAGGGVLRRPTWLARRLSGRPGPAGRWWPCRPAARRTRPPAAPGPGSTRPSGASSWLISPAQNAATSRSSATCWSAGWSSASIAANASVPLAPTATSTFPAGAGRRRPWPGRPAGRRSRCRAAGIAAGIGGLPPATTSPLTPARVSCGYASAWDAVRARGADGQHGPVVGGGRARAGRRAGRRGRARPGRRVPPPRTSSSRAVSLLARSASACRVQRVVRVLGPPAADQVADGAPQAVGGRGRRAGRACRNGLLTRRTPRPRPGRRRPSRSAAPTGSSASGRPDAAWPSPTRTPRSTVRPRSDSTTQARVRRGMPPADAGPRASGRRAAARAALPAAAAAPGAGACACDPASPSAAAQCR